MYSAVPTADVFSFCGLWPFNTLLLCYWTLCLLTVLLLGLPTILAFCTPCVAVCVCRLVRTAQQQRRLQSASTARAFKLLWWLLCGVLSLQAFPAGGRRLLTLASSLGVSGCCTCCGAVLFGQRA